MKKIDRQKAILLIAGACVAIALYSLLPSKPADVPPEPMDAMAAGAGFEDATSDQAGQGGSASPETYRTILAQLLRFQAEHTEPFISEEGHPIERNATSGAESQPTREIGLPHDMPVRPVLVGAPVAVSREEPTERSSETASPPASPPVENAVVPPHLRGRIIDRTDGKAVVILDWNGRLVRATTDPNSEWRILKITPDSVLVQHAEQTFTLEVPHAK